MSQNVLPLCLFCEWVNLSSRIATNTTSKDVVIDIANKYNIDQQQLLEIIKPITQFEELLSESVNTKDNDFQFFFAPINDDKITFAQTFTRLYHTPSEYQRRDYSDVPSKDWVKTFAHSLSDMLNEEDGKHFIKKHNITDAQSLVAVVVASDLEEAIKYRFTIAITQPSWCIERLWNMFEPNQEHWQKHEAQLQQFAFNSLQTWLNKYDNVFDLIDEKVNVQGIDAFKNVNIIPSIFNFNTLSIIEKDPFLNSLKHPTLHIGSMIFDLSDAVKVMPQENERLLMVLKTLSDKSKFEILRVCKDNPMYGQQVATHLQITTATASYHLNALVNMGYLSLNVKANRIYYQSKPERIQTDLDLIKQIFE